jgi:DNA-binding NtrC family response regulator
VPRTGYSGTLVPGPHRGRRSARTVLAITPHEHDRVALETILRFPHWRLLAASSLKEALTCLREPDVSVAICERDLPDGTWLTLLEALSGLASRPNLIVCSRLADDGLWAEVLNLGGYDLLLTPFDREEVLRVVCLAAGTVHAAAT